MYSRAQADTARRGAAAKTEVIWLDFTVGSEIDGGLSFIEVMATRSYLPPHNTLSELSIIINL